MFATKSFLSGAVGEAWEYSAVAHSPGPGKEYSISKVLLIPACVWLELISFHDIEDLKLLPHWRSWFYVGAIGRNRLSSA